VQGLPFNQGFMGPEIQIKDIIFIFQGQFVVWDGPSEDGPHTGQENPFRHRLHQVLIRSKVKSHHGVLFASHGG